MWCLLGNIKRTPINGFYAAWDLAVPETKYLAQHQEFLMSECMLEVNMPLRK